MLIKRIFDLIVAIFGLIILSPVFLVITLLIKLDSSGPILFRQERVGLHGRVFLIHKFRTMLDGAESQGPKITIGADNRITRVGSVLRRFKLDELPQLIDVLFGSMSLVGPRPEVPEYVVLYPVNVREQILSVRPGITDWASITMINESQILAESANPKEAYIKEIMPQKLALAMKYVATRTFWQDIKIIFATLGKIRNS